MTKTIKTAESKATKTSPPAAVKDLPGIAKPQLRILAALAKKPAQTSHQLVKTAKICTSAWVVEYIGHKGMEVGRVIRGGQPVGPMKLIPAKLVTALYDDEVGVTYYSITPAGSKVLASQPK